MRRRFFSSSNSETNYCTLEALSDGLFQFESKEADVYYRLDRQGVFYKFNINHRSIPIKKGQVIELKGKNCTGNVGSIFTDASFNLSGNSLSLIFGDDYKNKYDISNYPYVFYSLFDNVNIVNVSSDFLPATILSTGCYSNMFEGCTSLVNAPELPSQDLVFNCYDNMFKGCTNLNYIKMLATDISASYCLNNWVSGVSTTGTFVKHPEATWDVRGVNGVPEGWTIKFDGEEEEPLFPVKLKIGNNGEKGRELYEYFLALKAETGVIDFFIEPGNVLIGEENCTLIGVYSLAVEYYHRIILMTEEHNSPDMDCYFLYDNGLLELYID